MEKHTVEKSEAAQAVEATKRGFVPCTFLLVWNPTQWPWSSERMAEQTAELDAGKRVTLAWSTGQSKQPLPGDRVFFIQLGMDPRGVFASGTTTSAVYQRPHWDKTKSENGVSNMVDVEFDELLDPRETPPLAQADLKREIGAVHWSPQGSGTEVSNKDAAAKLEVLWQRHLHSLGLKLRFVHDESQLWDSVKSYALALAAGDERTKFGVWNCYHFVFKTESGTFAPTKWAAFRGMNLVVYRALQDLQKTEPHVRGFSGSPAYRHVERLTKRTHVPDDSVRLRMESEYQKRFGVDVLGPTGLSAAKVLTMQESTAGNALKGSARFDEIMQALGDMGLHFAPEVVANFLLALQTKRFVILTGISGTGKTRLALEVAKRFSEPPAPKVKEMEDVTDVVVQPYMRRHSRIIVPAALAATFLAEPDLPLKGRVAVSVKGERHSLAYNTRAGTNLFEVYFSGNARLWFLETFKEGDIVRLKRLESDDGAGVLSLSVPETQPVLPALAQYEVIPVRPDWTDHRGLLGFYNALTQQYVMTAFVKLLIRAHKEETRADRDGDAARPFFAILDEMNLARVEHYFSDFLSAMESGEAIDLHTNASLEAGENEDGIAIPRKMCVPRNLFFVGTVNVDETTYLFSPKVLDRGFTMEFNDVDLRGYGDKSEKHAPSELTLTKFSGELRYDAAPSSADWSAFGKLAGGRLRELVLVVNDILTAENKHFGYRVANEIGRFVVLADQQSEGEAAIWAAMDSALVQKVLPKLHGTQQELEDLLVRLLSFGVTGQSLEQGAAAERVAGFHLQGAKDVSTSGEGAKLPRFAVKVARMLRRLRGQGFTSFVE